MKQKRHPLLVVISLFLAGCFLFAGCGSTTLIRSVPSGAKVYMDGEIVGETPYDHYDTKIVGSKTSMNLVLDGYEDFNVTLTRNEDLDVGALIGSIFFFPIPLLWIMQYKPLHTYELIPLTEISQESTVVKAVEQPVESTSQAQKKAEDLIQMKVLLDKGVLTKEEFEVEKKKILAE
jgi:hypothetical protein